MTIQQINEVVGKAIKEALNDCVKTSCTQASGNPKEAGFQVNPKIKMPLPKELEAFEQLKENMLTKSTVGPKVDEFIGLLNEAAENAAPKCQPLLLAAVAELSTDNARGLFESEDKSACANYMEASCKADLIQKCKEPVTEVLKTSTVASVYDTLVSAYNSIPMVTKIEYDLKDYVVLKTVEGLFVLIKEREAMIRADPKITSCQAVIDAFGNTTIYQGF